jgi:hypothetical protein
MAHGGCSQEIMLHDRGLIAIIPSVEAKAHVLSEILNRGMRERHLP